jgi:hypothetical protein
LSAAFFAGWQNKYFNNRTLDIMKSAIFMIVLCFAANPVFGQESMNPAYKIRAQKGGVTVTFQGRRHRLNVGQQIDAAKVTSSEVIFANQKDGFRYLVINVSGDSRDSDFDRQCGAGIESNLIWLKLDSAWMILDIKSARYQSCWSGIDLDEPFKITKNTLTIVFDNFRDDVNTKLSYNSDEPEKGFQIVETKLKEN